MDDPFEHVTAAFADVNERLVDYAKVWRQAVDRNAEGAYRAEDLLVDLQTVWGMGVRDAARVSSAIVEVLAPLVPRDPAADAHRGAGAEDGGKSSDDG